jgi:TonB-linked SusC/RagA family outer membrane protein
MTDAPLEKVFVAIKAQTGYTFFYTEDELQHFSPISIAVKGAALEEVLNRCFEHQAYSYTIVDKMVVVRMKDALPGTSQTAITAQAPTERVTGVVTGETGQPIAGVNVTSRKTRKGVTTDETGAFSINVEPGDVLSFSYVGMETQEVRVGNQTKISITLTKGNKLLEEVIVEGYGSAKKQSDVVGSVTTVGAKDIQEKPVADMLDALQGKVPGLLILSSSGEPSSQVSLSLNGIGSLSADVTPLFVLDGIPVAEGTVLALNPADVESMNVLRDASATSIYGARAANGVVFVTSKKGIPGRDVINVSSQYGVSQLTDKKFFNNFMDTKELTDLFVAEGYMTRSYVNDTLLVNYPNNTTWYKYYYKNNTPTYQENLSLSGGTSKTTYFVSGSYFKSEGLAYRSGYDRYTFRANLTSKVEPWLTMGLNLAGGYNTYQTNPSGSNSTNRGLSWLAQPYYSPIDPATHQEYPIFIPGWNHYTPQYRANELPNPVNTLQMNPQGYLELTPIKGLVVRSQAGIDGYDQRIDAIQLPSFQASPANGSVSEQFSRSITEDVNTTAEYSFSLHDTHNFNVLVGQEYIDTKSSNFQGSSTGQTDDRLIQLDQGPKNKTVSSNKAEYAYISYFGRVEYNFAEKYFLNVSGRQDESSLFGADKRDADFGSVGVMWQAKKERFLQSATWLNDLSVKLNYGSSGNSAIANYQALALVGTNQYNGQTGWDINAPGNPDLTWEKVKQTTFGITGSVFNRIHLGVDVYNKVTSSMLVSVPYPYTTGFSSITSNVGSLRNRGVNLSLDLDVLKARDFNLTAHFTMNYNQEEVTKLFQGLNYWIIPNTGVCWVVGKPVSFFYPIFAQVNSQTGNPEWYVPNADPAKIVVTNKDPKNVTTNFESDALQQNTGIRVNPPLSGGFGLDGNYKGFYVSVNFSFVGKKYIINNDQYFYDNPTVFTGYNQSKESLNYWQKPGDVTAFPSLNNQFTQFDSKLIENASFVRMKLLSVGYNLPKGLLQKTKVIKGIKVYVTGRNLLTFTKYPGVDPEVNSNLTLGSYPNTKQFVGGLDVQF